MKLENLKETRKAMKMKQKDFAKKYHIPVRTLQNWENRITEPPKYILWMIDQIIILENELENIKGGQLLLDPEQETAAEETKSTDTGRKQIFKDIKETLEYYNELSCKICKYNKEENCNEHECEWKNYINYEKYLNIIAEELEEEN